MVTWNTFLWKSLSFQRRHDATVIQQGEAKVKNDMVVVFETFILLAKRGLVLQFKRGCIALSILLERPVVYL